MLEDHALITRIVSRFHIIVTVIVALFAAAFLGISAGEGDFSNIYLAIFGAVFIALTIALGKKYWFVVVFAFTTQLPAVPIKNRLLELPELAAVLGTVVFLLRYAVKRQALSIIRKEHVPVLLYTGWVMIIFTLHPVGLADAGAALGGARFYAKILLALAAFLIMANQEVTEKDCKWILILLLVGSTLETFYQIALYFLPVHLIGLDAGMMLSEDPDSFYSWQQALAQVPILLITLGFARYKASELFSLNRLWAVIGFGLSVVMIAMSGKRAALASVPVFALSAAAVRREWGYVVLWLSGAILAGSVIVLGHGDLFRLPLTIQRALSVLPAKWDSEMDLLAGGQDLFRAELRRQAILKIEKNPWVGEGYQVNLSLAQALTAQYATRGGDTELQVTPFAMSSAWHNTWLGYAADFGIPASVLAGVIYLTVLRRAWKTFKELPPNSLTQTLVMYIFLYTVRDLAFSHTGGHSATDAFARWWMYGLLVALALTHRKQLTAQSTTKPLAGGRSAAPSGYGDRPARQPVRVQRPATF